METADDYAICPFTGGLICVIARVFFLQVPYYFSVAVGVDCFDDYMLYGSLAREIIANQATKGVDQNIKILNV